jgi:hypothetical protein
MHIIETIAAILFAFLVGTIISQSVVYWAHLG